MLIWLLTPPRKDNPDIQKVQDFLNLITAKDDKVFIYEGDWEDDPPWKHASLNTPDVIISYRSRWIVPLGILQSVNGRCYNFHPGPPEYPGYGCVSFSLYDRPAWHGPVTFGVTCHKMEPKVDSGPIIAVSKFKQYPNDTVDTLLERTHNKLLTLYYDMLPILLRDRFIPESAYKWSNKKHSKKDLENLKRITKDMPDEEVLARIRATSTKDRSCTQPYMDHAGQRWEWVCPSF